MDEGDSHMNNTRLTSKKPLISVVIPTYNRVHYLAKTIDSVLNQTYPNIEIIVVDDGSKDTTIELLKNYGSKIRFIQQSNRGAPFARNEGARHAHGQYISFLDDDDFWLPNKIEAEVEFLEKNPDYGFVYCDTHYINEQGEITGKRMLSYDEVQTFERLYQGNFIISTSVVLVRKSCLDTVGIFDESLPQSQDYDLWLRLAKRFKFAYLDKILCCYRVQEKSLSKNLERRLQCHLKILEKSEINEGKTWLQKRVRVAEDYYYIATTFYKIQNYLKASRYYLGSLCIWPFIGFYHWPKEVKGVRFSFFYRILRTYFLVFYCLWKHFFPTREVIPLEGRALRLPY